MHAIFQLVKDDDEGADSRSHEHQDDYGCIKQICGWKIIIIGCHRTNLESYEIRRLNNTSLNPLRVRVKRNLGFLRERTARKCPTEK
jgi:hypothetical protein